MIDDMLKRYISEFITKYKKMSVVTKAALWFTFATVLQKGISFFTVPIFTRIMSTEQYGIFSVYLSWISVLTILGGMDFHTCIYINNLSKMENEKEKNELAVSLIDLSFLITLCWLIVYLIAPTFWYSVLGIPESIVVLMFAEVFFIPVVNLWSTKQRYNYRYKTLVAWTVGQVFLNALFGFVFVLLAKSNNQAFARVFSIALVQVLFGTILIVSYVKKARKIIVTKWWKKALQLHIPLLPHSLSLTVLSSADRVMINSMVGATETAIYSVAYSASMVINLIKLSITQAMTPWIYECIKHKRYGSIKKNCNAVMLLVMLMSFLFILFAPELIWIVGSNEYYEAIYVVPPVAASVFFTFLYSIFSAVEFYYEQTQKIMYASVGAAVLNVILNAIFIRAFGYIAAGYTTLACYLFLSVAHYYVMKKAVKDNIGDVELFDMRFILILGIVVIFSTAFFSLLYSHTIIRYAVIALAVLEIYLNRSRLVNAIKMVKKKS